jgi:hypothetical protein
MRRKTVLALVGLKMKIGKKVKNTTVIHVVFV